MSGGDRLRHWMESDLVGIPVTLAAVIIVGSAIAAFIVAGPLAGLLFAGFGLLLVYLLIVRPGAAKPERRMPADTRPAHAGDGTAPDHPHRVLVVANQGLQHADLPQLLQRINTLAAPAQVRIIAPAAPATRLARLADDVDSERRAAEARLNALIEMLTAAGVSASGVVDEEAGPRSALVDGIREFGADEIVLVRGSEAGWVEAASVAGELREDGIAVTTLSAPE